MKMGLFRRFLDSFFPNNRTPQGFPEDRRENPDGCFSDYNRYKHKGWNDDDDESRFGGVEDMWKEIDDTFDELFRTFGVDNIPMFDPYIPPHAGGAAGRQKSHGGLPADSNVRDRMLRGRHQPLYDDEEVNVRSKMLKRNYQNSQPSVNSSNQKDINWDSLLKEGGTVNDILDGSKRTTPPPDVDSSQDSPQSKSFFRYSRVVTTRKPDGTIETRRITRDESGNERETVEVKRGS